MPVKQSFEAAVIPSLPKWKPCNTNCELMLVEQIAPHKERVSLPDLKVFTSKTSEIKPFDKKIVSFLDAVSKRIMRNKQINRVPEIAALAFWLRVNNLQQIRSENEYLFRGDRYCIAPLGIVFHVCPSNVDTMFVYSLALALLMGNKNILRIPSRLNQSAVRHIFEIMNELMAGKEFEVLQYYLNIISYGHDEEINIYLNCHSDARIIWGGDATIETFKQLKSNPRIRDIVFPDRVSLSLFKAAAFQKLDSKNQAELVRKFYNDAFTFDQMGCSSPQTLLVMANSSEFEEFQEVFYGILENEVKSQYHVMDMYSMATLKLNHLALDVIEGNVNGYLSSNNKLMFAIQENSVGIDLHTCGGGYFYLRRIKNLNDFSALINPKVQTLSYFGFERDEIDKVVYSINGYGIDRVVPVGQALDFHYLWDGYNLVEELCRKVHVVYNDNK